MRFGHTAREIAGWEAWKCPTPSFAVLHYSNEGVPGAAGRAAGRAVRQRCEPKLVAASFALALRLIGESRRRHRRDQCGPATRLTRY